MFWNILHKVSVLLQSVRHRFHPPQASVKLVPKKGAKAHQGVSVKGHKSPQGPKRKRQTVKKK